MIVVMNGWRQAGKHPKANFNIT